MDELLTTVTACAPLFAFQAAIVPSSVPKRNKADVLPGISKIALLLLYTVPLGLPCADAEVAAGIVTGGITELPAAVSTATEPLPALSIQMAGPTETPQGLISVGSVTSACTVAPSEIMFVCTYVLLVCAKAPIERIPERAPTTRMRLKEDEALRGDGKASRTYDIKLLLSILLITSAALN